MWDVVLDVFWPSKGSEFAEGVLGKKTKPDELRVELALGSPRAAPQPRRLAHRRGDRRGHRAPGDPAHGARPDHRAR